MGDIRERIYLVEHQNRQEIVGGWLRVSSRQQRSLYQRQGYARLQDCIGFSESSSSDRLTDEQENEIAENIYDWWTSGLGYRQWYAQKFLQLKLDFDAPPS